MNRTRTSGLNMLAGCCLLIAGFARAGDFGALLESEWVFVEANATCELSASIEHYGVARFVGVPGRGLRFELEPLRDLFAGGRVTATSVGPEWRAEPSVRVSRGTLRHVKGGIVSAGDPLATTLLMDLYQGQIVEIGRASWFEENGADGIGVHISPVRFRVPYEDFMSCYQWLMPANYEEVERTRMVYNIGAHGLDAEDHAALALVAAYVQADPQVTQVFIDGHTDASGDEQSNLRLSQSRANAVAKALQSYGVDKSMVTVRYHAARYPVADNDVPGGRAQNRRTTVRLQRGDETSVAAK